MQFEQRLRAAAGNAEAPVSGPLPRGPATTPHEALQTQSLRCLGLGDAGVVERLRETRTTRSAKREATSRPTSRPSQQRRLRRSRSCGGEASGTYLLTSPRTPLASRLLRPSKSLSRASR